MLKRLRTQLLSAQTGRNPDLEHWWTLPDDVNRARTRWLQPLVDMVAPAPFTEWHRRIAGYRVVHYDGVRPPLSRATCLVVIAVALGVAGAPWWYWALLIPAVVQFPLDVYLHTHAVPDTEDPQSALNRWLVESARENRHRRALNAGGLAATLACPLNIVAVCFAPSPAGAGWVKIAALAAAVLYLNSALAQGFLDPPYYSETSLMPPVMHALRPHAPLIALVLVSALVGASIAAHRWEPDLAPVAVLTAGLTLLSGATIRDHDRVIAAAARVGVASSRVVYESDLISGTGVS